MEYKVIDFKVGKYDYDTLFIEVDNKTVQIPIIKGIGNPELIGTEIVIDKLDAPIESI